MNVLKISALCLAISSVPAVTMASGDVSMSSVPAHSSHFSGQRNISSGNTYVTGGSQASFFMRVGESQFEKGNLEKAERAFEVVLRSNNPTPKAHHYLAIINDKQGDKAKSEKHAEAYISAYKAAFNN